LPVAFSANDGGDEKRTVQSSETRMTLRPQKRGADDQPRILAALYTLAELS
jgi:hypothetical protein